MVAETREQITRERGDLRVIARRFGTKWYVELRRRSWWGWRHVYWDILDSREAMCWFADLVLGDTDVWIEETCRRCY